MRYSGEAIRFSDAELIKSERLARILAVSLFVVLTTLSAFVRVYLPFTPVPLTMQTFFVILSGLFLKKFDGSAAQIAYLALGAAGLPVFAAGASGFSYILGPTGGYLVAFAIAPLVVNALYSSLKFKSVLKRAIVALLAGNIVIHLLGVFNLSTFLNIGIMPAFAIGSLPFVPGDLLKVFAAAASFSAYRRLTGK